MAGWLAGRLAARQALDLVHITWHVNIAHSCYSFLVLHHSISRLYRAKLRVLLGCLLAFMLLFTGFNVFLW